MDSITTLLAANPYPGRGIVVGLTPDGANAAMSYFIMGRSASSRNRRLIDRGDAVYTQAVDDRIGFVDPSLYLYPAMKVVNGMTIITNGDQTNTIASYLGRGRSFEEALRTRSYEPDEPNYTPRISALASVNMGGLSYRVSILRERGGTTFRAFYEYTGVAGEGHLIHTYVGDGFPLPPFEGEPFNVGMMDDIDDWTELVWRSLDRDNRVSLLTRYLNLASGKTVTKIVNRHDETDETDATEVITEENAE